jgi:hypothetical protein
MGGAGGGATAPATLAWPGQGQAGACVAAPGAWRCLREETSAVLRGPPIRLTVWPWAASKRASGATAGLASRPLGQSSAHAAGPVPPEAFHGCRHCRASAPGAAPTAGGSQRHAGASCPTRPQWSGPLGEEPSICHSGTGGMARHGCSLSSELGTCPPMSSRPLWLDDWGSGIRQRVAQHPARGRRLTPPPPARAPATRLRRWLRGSAVATPVICGGKARRGGGVSSPYPWAQMTRYCSGLWNVDRACMSTWEAAWRPASSEGPPPSGGQSRCRRAPGLIVAPFAMDAPTQASWDLAVTADAHGVCPVTHIPHPLSRQTCPGRSYG